jgi:hypothetical protein
MMRMRAKFLSMAPPKRNSVVSVSKTEGDKHVRQEGNKFRKHEKMG